MRTITALFLLWMSKMGTSQLGEGVFPKVSKGLGDTFYQDAVKSHADVYIFGNLTRQRREVIGKMSQRRQHRHNRLLETVQKRDADNSSAFGLNMPGMMLRPISTGGMQPLTFVGLNGNSSVTGTAHDLLGQLVAQDPSGNVAAGMAQLQLPKAGGSGPVYELVGAGIKLQPPTTWPPPLRPPIKNSSAVGEVTVNIQHTNKDNKRKPKPRHWCDLSGVWINDEGSLLLTLGFPSSDKTLLTGYLSQVSVDMTPHDDHPHLHKRRRRQATRRYRRRSLRRRSLHSLRRRRRQAAVTAAVAGVSATFDDDEDTAPHFPPPAAGTSGIPSSLANRTVLQGSSVTRAGPFTVVTRHGGNAVGSMVGQCQLCGGLDTIVAQFISVSEVFTCLDALWSQKLVHFMFRKWGERHRPRNHERPRLLETEVVIKQHDRSHPPQPPPLKPQTLQVHEEVVEKYTQP